MLRERDSRRSLAAEKPAIHARRSEASSANSSYADEALPFADTAIAHAESSCFYRMLFTSM